MDISAFCLLISVFWLAPEAQRRGFLKMPRLARCDDQKEAKGFLAPLCGASRVSLKIAIISL